VLAAVIERDGQELSATELLTRNLSNADHLAILHADWTAETPRLANATTETCSPPPCPPGTRTSPATRPDGYGAPCAPQNSPARTPGT
jgi:hypothetical protein